jgi:serine/threonine-protein kinase
MSQSPLLPGDSDRNLLFGVLALQADLIDEGQFVEACTVWASRKQSSLAELLCERGWISDQDRRDLDRLFERKLKRHGNDVRASLAAACDAARQSLVAYAESQCTLDTPTGSVGKESNGALAATGLYQPSRRDRYRLDRLHATGGIGRVWQAHDAEFGREVALKELRPDRRDKPDHLARFVREAQITGQLEHPGIVPVYELNRRAESGQPFYVMRFIRGRTLSQAIGDYYAEPRGTMVEFRKLLGALVEVCNAVAYAHARGVVHRDLKGSNIVLGNFGEVIVLDWGLAKLVADAEPAADRSLVQAPDAPADETQAGVVVGTPGYMAPEQAEGTGARVGPSSDVYGLGAILYEILTGQPPHTGSDRHELLRRARDERPPTPRSVRPGTPPALEAVCVRALSRDPKERYSSATDLAAEIERWLADEPVQAWPEPLPVRAGRWARRHRPLLAGAAALLLTAVVSLAINNVMLGNEKKRTEEAKTKTEDALVLANTNYIEMERQRTLAQGSEAAEKVAHQATDTARQRAIANLRKACDSVDQMLTRVGEDPTLLAYEPRMEQVRRRLLQDALDYYQDFLQEHADDAELRRETVRAARRAANILQDLGRHAEAAPIYKQAVTLCSKLVDEFPKDASYKQELGGLHNSLGILYMARGEYKQADTAYAKALDIKRDLVKTYDRVPDYQQELANTLHNRGRLLRELGKTEPAIEAVGEAIQIRQVLIELYSRQPTYRYNLGRDLNVYANLLGDRGARDEEETVLRQTLALQEELTNEYPGVPDYRQALALTHMNLGILLRKTSRPDKAEDELKESLKLRKKLADDFPSIPRYRSEYARTFGSLALCLDELQRPADAIKAGQDGVDIQKKLADDFPHMPELRSQLATGRVQLGYVLLHAGEVKAAEKAFQDGVDVAKKLVAEYPNVPDYRNTLSILYQDVGATLLERKEVAKARAQFELAQQSSRDALKIQPWHFTYREAYHHQVKSFLHTLDQLKEHAAMAETAEELRRVFDDESINLYIAARYLSRASTLAAADESLSPEKRQELAARHADRAIDALRAAVGFGFKDGKRLKNDGYFAAVSGRDEFKAMEAKLNGGKFNDTPK